MSSRETAIIFDDGSIESKVLQFELKTSYDIQTVPVEKYSDLQTWIEKAIEYTEGAFKGILKIILHFPFEDYVQKDIRDQVMELQRKNPNLRIILWYEQAPRQNIKNRAANYGILAEPAQDNKPQKIKEIEESIKSGSTLIANRIDPDDEMKENVKNIASDIVKETPTYRWPEEEPATTKPKKKKRKWNI